MEQQQGILKYLITIVFFPTFFQEAFITYSLGAEDPFWIQLFKRIFLVLPTFAIILACWVSIACILSIVIRQNRRQFIIVLLMTWWDLGRTIFFLWGGIIKAVFVVTMALWGLLRVVLFGLWMFVIDIILLPLRLIRDISGNVLAPGIPWIAVFLTLVWCFLEAIVFTYVTTPLVLDTLSNLTGDELSEIMIRLPLFLFMLFLILGSYAVLSTWTDSLRERKIANIIRISIIEAVAMLVEIVFLYREFVDSLVPWFAQHSSGQFELGIAGTLIISGLAWMGIRGMSWFLFAAHGTPTIMAIIQGVGIPQNSGNDDSKGVGFEYSTKVFQRIKSDLEWVHQEGEKIVGAVVLPPLQIIGCCINFITLLLTTQHLFTLPFESLNQVTQLRLKQRLTTTVKESKK